MRNLITGVTGFAGQHLARHLMALGDGVAGVALAATARTDEMPGVHLFDGDVRDADRLCEVVAAVQPEIVYHLAGFSHIGRSWEHLRETLEINVVGTGVLLDAVARHAERARVLLVSTGQVYGQLRHEEVPLSEEHPTRPASPYAASKLCVEILGRQAAAAGVLHVVIVRPFNFAGPGQDPSFVCSDFARQIARAEAGLQEPILRVGNLGAERDFTDVRDTVRGFAAAATRGAAGTTYNLCSGRAVVVRSILDHLVSLAGCPIEVRDDPERIRPIDVPRFVGDPARAREELGWQAETPLRQTLADTLDYWRRLTGAELAGAPRA